MKNLFLFQALSLSSCCLQVKYVVSRNFGKHNSFLFLTKLTISILLNYRTITECLQLQVDEETSLTNLHTIEQKQVHVYFTLLS